MNIDSILQEADQIIEKRASQTSSTEKTASAQIDVSSDSLNLAEEIIRGDHDFSQKLQAEPTKVASTQESALTPMEKVAHAVAIVDTLLNLAEFQKLEKVAESAIEKGYTQEQVDGFIEKKAEEMEIVTIAPMVGLAVNGMEKEGSATKTLAGMLKSPKFRKAMAATGIAGTAGASYSQGKKSGYDEALGDVRKAFESYK